MYSLLLCYPFIFVEHRRSFIPPSSVRLLPFLLCLNIRNFSVQEMALYLSYAEEEIRADTITLLVKLICPNCTGIGFTGFHEQPKS